jgi:hypothetical protein
MSEGEPPTYYVWASRARANGMRHPDDYPGWETVRPHPLYPDSVLLRKQGTELDACPRDEWCPQAGAPVVVPGCPYNHPSLAAQAAALMLPEPR